MELLLQIILAIAIAILIITGSAFIVFSLYYLSWFHWRPCKHCGHHMEYKGLKGDEDEGHYLFNCSHCGAWQQIPRQEFIRGFVETESSSYKDSTM